ncbi:uncharacterized protein LOC135108555 [Scylla paramamosain]|uniref:uncharacterized protein LOC135108555 n=1 Tax=Scylla paramamosain TaxID=85552 RepID=UPI003083BB51
MSPALPGEVNNCKQMWRSGAAVMSDAGVTGEPLRPPPHVVLREWPGMPRACCPRLGVLGTAWTRLRSHGGDSCCKGEVAEERVREVVRGSVEAAGQCMGGAAPHPAINWRDGRCSLLTQTTSEKVQQERGLFVMPRRGCVTGGRCLGGAG